MQGQNNRHSLRESPYKIAREGPVMMNMDDVHITYREINSLGEARLRVFSRGALSQETRHAYRDYPIEESVDHHSRVLLSIRRCDELDRVT
jgi:hypothetical protein